MSSQEHETFLDFLIDRNYLTGQHAQTVRMLQNSRFFFGVLALREDIITIEQLEEVLTLQAKRNFKQKIGEIMLEKEYMSEEQVDRLLNMQESSADHQADLIRDVQLMDDEALDKALKEFEKYKSGS